MPSPHRLGERGTGELELLRQHPALGERRAEPAAGGDKLRRLIEVLHQPGQRLRELLGLPGRPAGQPGEERGLRLHERGPQPQGHVLGAAGELQAVAEQPLHLVQRHVVGRVHAVGGGRHRGYADGRHDARQPHLAERARRRDGLAGPVRAGRARCADPLDRADRPRAEHGRHHASDPGPGAGPVRGGGTARRPAGYGWHGGAGYGWHGGAGYGWHGGAGYGWHGGAGYGWQGGARPGAGYGWQGGARPGAGRRCRAWDPRWYPGRRSRAGGRGRARDSGHS
nr:hypothetical protein GCM10020092_083270 [Actinoplanes digitatis]